MFAKIDLVKQFGDWASVYWTAVQPILQQYEHHECKVGLVKSAKQHEAVLTIKLQKNAQNQGRWLEYAALAKLQADFPAFKNFCIDVTCELSRQQCVKLEFTVIDSENLTSDEMKQKRWTAQYRPSREMLASLEATCKPQFDKFMSVCSQLTSSDKERVRKILQLYCVSSEKTLAPKLVFIPSQPNILVISNVKYVSLSWIQYMLQQINLGIDNISLEQNELCLYLTPTLELMTEADPGPVRHKPNRRSQPDSLLSKLTRKIWPW